MAIYALLDDWDRNERDKPLRPDSRSVERTIRELSGRESADLFLLKDGRDVTETDRWLSVSASQGRYAISAMIEEGRPATVMGDPDAEGEVMFAHGGEFSQWPARFCVPVEDAVSLATGFVESDGELPEPTRWWLEPYRDQLAF